MTIILAEQPHNRSSGGKATPLAVPAAGPAVAPAMAPAAHMAAGTDADLAARAARGERGAFAAIYQRHVEAVFHYFSFRVHDTAVAEDLTHDVFMQALKAVRTLREPHRVAAWLMRIAHNRLANHWRDGAHAPEPFDLDDDGIDLEDGHRVSQQGRSTDHLAVAADDPAAQLDALADAGRVVLAAARLTALQQDVIALRFVVGLNVAETAEAMGRSVNAVKNLQHQALTKMRRDLASALHPSGEPIPSDPNAVAEPRRVRSAR